MAGWTNKGKYHVLNVVFRNATEKTNYYIALCTDATAPTAATNTLGQLTEIADGQGYTTGGFQLTPNATDFDVLTEDDTNSKALIQVKNVTWTATGGSIPASGDPIRYAVLIDDNATVGSREVYAWWDLYPTRTAATSEVITLSDLELDLTE